MIKQWFRANAKAAINYEVEKFIELTEYRLRLLEAANTDLGLKLDDIRRRVDPEYRRYKGNLANFMSSPDPDSDVYNTYGK